MTTNPNLDPDALIIRRVLAKAKGTRTRKRGHSWSAGRMDDTPYFQAALAELKQCREEGILK